MAVRLLMGEDSQLAMLGARVYRARIIVWSSGPEFRLAYRMKWVDTFGKDKAYRDLNSYVDAVQNLAEKLDAPKVPDITPAEFRAECKALGITDQGDVFPGYFTVRTRGGVLVWAKPRKSLPRREKLAKLKKTAGGY